MKRTILFLSLFVWSAIAQDAKLLTQKDVVQLLQLKMPEAEIITQVKASGTVFVLGEEDVARLKRAGASDALIAALQGGGAATGAQPDYEITDLALVIDYSGSMTAKTKEGSTKMAAAKEAVGKLIDKLPADLNVAVVVYGVSKSRGSGNGGQCAKRGFFPQHVAFGGIALFGLRYGVDLCARGTGCRERHRFQVCPGRASIDSS